MNHIETKQAEWVDRMAVLDKRILATALMAILEASFGTTEHGLAASEAMVVKYEDWQADLVQKMKDTP